MNPFEDFDHTPRSRCSVAAAILGAGALAAGASIFSADKAADAQTQASQNATNAQLGMFNTAKGIAQPFVNAGSDAISSLLRLIQPGSGIPGQIGGLLDNNNPGSMLSSLIRLVTPGPGQSSTLAQTPGFDFANTYGQKAVGNALAARGLAGPGGALAKGGANYAEGLAGTTWQSVVTALQNALTGGVSNLTSLLGSETTPLSNLVNTGSNASAGVGSNAIQTGGQVGGNMIGAGNAQAGAATATGNAIGNFGNSISTAAILQKLMGNGGGGGGLYGGNFNQGYSEDPSSLAQSSMGGGYGGGVFGG